MYQNKKVLVIIPARRGSKRIKEKNGILIGNKMLLQYSIEIAKKSKYVDEIMVSTDSKEWLDLAIKMGCMNIALRPQSLSTDTSRIVDVMIYEIRKYHLEEKFSAVILLQPTSPYRTVELLDGAIEKYFQTEESLITVVKCKENPIFMRKIENGELKKIIDDSSDIRSQDFETVYKIIGNIYINNIKNININTILNENIIPYIIDEKFAIDIDTQDDITEAKEILKENGII